MIFQNIFVDKKIKMKQCNKVLEDKNIHQDKIILDEEINY